MKIKKIKRSLTLILWFSISFAYSQTSLSITPQFQHPVDSLLARNDLSLLQRQSITMIKFWQSFSYSNPNLNCQFYPSCSNYCAIKIVNKGTTQGLIIGADRFLRCHDMANGKYYKDGMHKTYLSDSYKIPKDVLKYDKHLLIGILSSIIPGNGRHYYNRHDDGYNSSKYISGLMVISYASTKLGFPLIPILSGGMAILFYIGDFYAIGGLQSIYQVY